MPKENLTDRRIKSLKPAPKGKDRYEIADAIVPGLLIRVTEAGKKNFVLLARFPGGNKTKAGSEADKVNPTRRLIGEYGAITLEDARGKAREWHELLRKGVDPQTHIVEMKAQEKVRLDNTFESVLEDYIKRAIFQKDGKTLKLRNGHEMVRSLRAEFLNDKTINGRKRVGLARRPITGITKSDIVRVIDDKIDAGFETMAHNLFAHIRGFFNWAIDRDAYGIETSPCDRLKPKVLIGEKATRDRVLDDAEIKSFWIATGRISYPYGPLYRTLLLTGTRKREAADAVREELTLKESLWTIPKERMKGKIALQLPLSIEMMDIMKSVPLQNAGTFLFSTTAGEKAVNGFSKAKVILDREMLKALKELAELRGEDPDTVTLKPFVIHDIRRTTRTRLAKLGISEEVAEAVIAHKKKGLNAVYNQFQYLDEKRDALQRWANALKAIIDPPEDNVIPLTRRT